MPDYEEERKSMINAKDKRWKSFKSKATIRGPQPAWSLKDIDTPRTDAARYSSGGRIR